jgi:5-methylcytosine-specific restriction endonuclease McrA
MTAIPDLRGVLTDENVTRILDEAIGKDRDELKVIVARESAPLASAPPTMIRRLPTTRVIPIPPVVPLSPPAPLAPVSADPVLFGAEPPVAVVPAPATEKPEESYVIRMTVSREFMATLERVQSILSHTIPSGDVPEVLLRALQEVVRKDDKKHRIQPRKQKAPALLSETRKAARSAHVPADVAREVWERDGGRCTHATADGGVCGSTHQLEFDHSIPRAKGGLTTAKYLRLRCRRHNDKLARDEFGEAFMAAKKAAAREASARALRTRSGSSTEPIADTSCDLATDGKIRRSR